MRKKILIIAILIPGSILYLLSDHHSNKMKSISEFLKYEVDDKNTPSIQYAFFDADTITYQFHYGLQNVKENKAVNAATTYNIFSVTKTFTALSVLQLAQSGKIELNKPASDYIPDFPYSKHITVQQLLSHTSGIPNPLPLRWIHLASEHGTFNRDVFFKNVFRKSPKLKFEPGTEFKYSNLGYVLLGQLVEKVSGQKFEEYVDANIIKRANAEPGSLGFYLNPSVHATGYHKKWSLSNAILGFMIDKYKFMYETESGWKPFHNFYINGIAYGGMFGSANGLIKYAQALLKDSVLLNEKYRKILFSESEINGKPTGMSLSWFTGTLNGNQYYAHAGGGGGYYVELRVYPELKKGSVIMFNRSGMTDERILDRTDAFFLNANR